MLEWLLKRYDPNVTETFVLNGQWSLWEQALAIATALVIFALTAWNYRTTRSWKRRISMLTLRAFILMLLLFIFYQPAMVLETIQKSRNTVVVLVDDSESLALPQGDSHGTALIQSFFADKADFFESLSETSDVETFVFGAGLKPVPMADMPEAITARQTQTLMLEALEQVRERLRNKDIGGIVIATDGVDNGKLMDRVEDSVGLDEETRRFVETLRAPIFPVLTADLASVKDVGIQKIQYNNFVFVLNASSLQTTVRITGYAPGTAAIVSLFENGQSLATKTVTVEPERRDYPVTFDFVPRRLGNQVFTVYSPPLPEDVYAGNNEKNVIINVIRDRIRVLQICGHPSWDERFFRNWLKRNPNIDLISFFILINPRNSYAISQAETTLIPFPTHELFVEELGGFDLIVFQDFNHGPFQTREHLFRVRDFVKNGGAFLMIGGARAFSEGGYFGTEITEVLPVEIAPSFGDGSTLDHSRFSPVLTDPGKRHPITRLRLDPGANEDLWATLPPLEGLNEVVRIKPNGVSLLDHPTEKMSNGGAAPVVAVSEAGEGRVMTLLTDSTWLWSFRQDEGGSSSAYSTFWDNAIRWLIRDPELDLVRILLEGTEHPKGAPLQATVRVLGLDYKPIPGQKVHVTVKRRGGVNQWNQAAIIADLPDARSDESGDLVVDIPTDQTGVVEITASSKVVDRVVTGSRLVVVVENNPELENIVPKTDVMRLLAEASSGQTYLLTDNTFQPAFREPEILKVTKREEQDLWSGADILAIACLLFGLEWWLRRKLGYL